MLGVGQSGTQRAAEYGSSPIDPTTLAALEHCRAFLSFLPLPFEVDRLALTNDVIKRRTGSAQRPISNRGLDVHLGSTGPGKGSTRSPRRPRSAFVRQRRNGKIP